MRNILLRYWLLLAAGLSLAACNVEEDDALVQSIPSFKSSEKLFGASFSNTSLSKSRLVFGNSETSMVMSFSSDDSLSVFSSGINNKFTLYTGSNFKGESADSQAYYALFPYQGDASIDGNVISARIPEEVSYADTRYNPFGGGLYYPQGAFAVGYTTDADRSFELKNAVSIVKLNFPYSSRFSNGMPNLEKVIIEANKNIAGDVKIKVGDDGTSEISGGTSNVITIYSCSIYYPYVPILPVSDVDLKISYYYPGDFVVTMTYNDLSFAQSEITFMPGIEDERDFRLPRFHVKFDSGIDGEDIYEMSSCILTSFAPYSFYSPEREGYFLQGWDGSDGNVYGPDDVFLLTKDVTFTAIWEKTYAIAFPIGNNTVYCKPGESIILPEGQDAWNKVFDHYDVDGTAYYPGDQVVLNADSQIELVYLRENKVIIDANGGTFADGSSKMEWNFPENPYDGTGYWPNFGLVDNSGKVEMLMAANNNVKEYRPIPVREGYELQEFSYCSGSLWPGRNNVYGSSRDDDFCSYSLVAKWVRVFKIEYFDENGNLLATSNYRESDRGLELDDLLSVDGKEQKGWRDQDGNVYRVGSNLIQILDELHDLKLTPIFK